jgi:hypothetical protein
MAVLPMIATPANEFAEVPPVTVSAVSLNRAENRVLMVAPGAEVEMSSLTCVNVAGLEAIGASLMAVTLVLRVTAFALLL